MDEAEKFMLRQYIAALIDHPSVYMNGPSIQSRRIANRIVTNILAEYDLTPKDPERIKAHADQVRTWRTEAWDSLA